MKKLAISTFCGMAALLMVGCSSSSQDNAIKNLSNQLDRVTNTVSSISDNQLAYLTPQNYPIEKVSKEPNSYANDGSYGKTSLSQIAKLQKSTYAQSSLKKNLLSAVAMLKSSMSDRVKLNKSQIKALTGLTNNISKYVSALNGTKGDIGSSIKQIKKNSSDSEQTPALYQTLNNHLDARMCYFQNLLNSINQAEKIILGYEENNEQDKTCPDCPDPQGNGTIYYNDFSEHYNYSDNSNNSSSQTSQPISQKSETEKGNSKNEKSSQSKNKKFAKNIDTYRPNPNYNPVNNPQNGNIVNNAYNNGYNSGYYNSGYYNDGVNGYYYGYYRGPFNPNRNTDTYRPGLTNIDTYRANPNMNNGAYNYGVANNGAINNGVYGNNVGIPVSTSDKPNLDTKIESKEKLINKDATPSDEKSVKASDLLSNGIESKGHKIEKEIKKDNLPRQMMIKLEIDPLKTNKNIEKLIKG